MWSIKVCKSEMSYKWAEFLLPLDFKVWNIYSLDQAHYKISLKMASFAPPALVP